MDYDIQVTCPRCDGTGTASSEAGGNVACDDCGGDGTLQSSVIKDLRDDVNDIQDKLNDIWEKLNE